MEREEEEEEPTGDPDQEVLKLDGGEGDEGPGDEGPGEEELPEEESNV